MIKYFLTGFIFFTVAIHTAFAQVSVLTQHNDNMRTGANTVESTLNISNVDTAHFGLLCERLVDDEVYAQPLVVAGINMPSYGVRNVLYLATVNNTVYAYDADDRLIVNPYWVVNLTPAGSRVPRALDYSMAGACGGDYRDFSGNMGIVSTPVIDTVTNTIYVLTKNRVTLSGEYQQWLHALDIRDGSEKPFSPVKMEASMPGHGNGNINNVMYFDAFYENQRAALILSDGVIYITWAGFCDFPPYNGWVLGYDAHTLDKVVTYSTAPNGWAAGVWMSGGGISADESGNLYLCTGNGQVGDGNDPTNLSNRGQSMLKLTRADTTLQVASYFTPYNWNFINDVDQDMGTCSVMLIPGTDMALTAGKEGYLYVADRDSMGGVDSVDHVRQRIDVGQTDCNGGSVYWHSDSGDYVYLWPSWEKPLLRYTVDHSNGTLDETSLQQSTMNNEVKPGGILSLSANGSQIGTGILWANVPLDWATAGVANRPGILRAFDAADITHEIWNSQMNAVRDSIKNYPKFVAPTIANGRVYMSTFSGKVNMYGIFNPDEVEELNPEQDIMCFPNPVKNIMNVYLKKNAGVFNLSVRNTIGETVYELDNITGHSISVDVSAFEKGIYFLTIETRSNVWTGKILKAE